MRCQVLLNDDAIPHSALCGLTIQRCLELNRHHTSNGAWERKSRGRMSYKSKSFIAKGFTLRTDQLSLKAVRFIEVKEVAYFLSTATHPLNGRFRQRCPHDHSWGSFSFHASTYMHRRPASEPCPKSQVWTATQRRRQKHGPLGILRLP